PEGGTPTRPDPGPRWSTAFRRIASRGGPRGHGLHQGIPTPSRPRVSRTSDRLEADVVDPHLADVGVTGDAEVQGQRGRLGLGGEDLLDLGPAADDLQAFVEAAALE